MRQQLQLRLRPRLRGGSRPGRGGAGAGSRSHWRCAGAGRARRASERADGITGRAAVLSRGGASGPGSASPALPPPSSPLPQAPPSSHSTSQDLQPLLLPGLGSPARPPEIRIPLASQLRLRGASWVRRGAWSGENGGGVCLGRPLASERKDSLAGWGLGLCETSWGSGCTPPPPPRRACVSGEHFVRSTTQVPPSPPDPSFLQAPELQAKTNHQLRRSPGA